MGIPVRGDLKSRIGKRVKDTAMGQFRDVGNGNECRLMNLCDQYECMISNILFQHRNIHKLLNTGLYGNNRQRN
jgi:hypothetical protein